MTINGKVAIVTGASSGIGLSTAKLLTEEGANVALVARNEEKLSSICRELKGSIFIVTDMAREKEIKEMISEVMKHFGKIDILINNAGQGYDAPIEKTDIAIVKKIYDLDVFGPLIAMQEVIPIMKKAMNGTIVNISSGTALMALPNNAAYSSAKSALAQISAVAQEELKKDGVNVSVIYPYITKTSFEINTIRDRSIKESAEESENSGPKPPDPPELVAKVIVDTIKSCQRVAYSHAWMKSLKS